jgi:hypothetical protein
MTGTKKQSTNRHVVFIATFLLAFALTSCSTSTKSTTKNALDYSQTTSTKSFSLDENISCDEHLAAAKTAHEVAAIHDEQFQDAKTKKRDYNNSHGYLYFAYEQFPVKKINENLDFSKKEAERHTLVAQQHDSAVNSLTAQEIHVCLLSHVERM